MKYISVPVTGKPSNPLCLLFYWLRIWGWRQLVRNPEGFYHSPPSWWPRRIWGFWPDFRPMLHSRGLWGLQRLRIADRWEDVTVRRYSTLQHVDGIAGQDAEEHFSWVVATLSNIPHDWLWQGWQVQMGMLDPSPQRIPSWFSTGPLARALDFLSGEVPYERVNAFQFGGKRYSVKQDIGREPLGWYITVERLILKDGGLLAELHSRDLSRLPEVVAWIVTPEGSDYSHAAFPGLARKFQDLPVCTALGVAEHFFTRSDGSKIGGPHYSRLPILTERILKGPKAWFKR